MCVSCMFYVDWDLEGWKKLKSRDLFDLKPVRLGLQGPHNLF